ncbi:hypothetical protein BOTBODRAFT_31689 [Botryobasidium botryosum FD-172 SS1]|uniref:Uncharacterized protein n=1 Tax=Botryobasidium botryosum (strain FD-172 SS1) TaxID=930990 RepID=A0A067MV02_BOTB1|nr:hypothetical protein BOTBODRAFT_31689 [Botryobasidium botryosum FD-172 SS1]
MVFGRISITWNKPHPHQRLPDDDDDDPGMPSHLPRNHDGYAHYTIPAHGGGRHREYTVETRGDILVDSSHPVVIIDERKHHRGISKDHGHHSLSGHSHSHQLSGAHSSSHAHDGSYPHSHSHNRLLSDSHSGYPPTHEYSDLPLHHHRDHRDINNSSSERLGAGQRKRPWLHPQHERCPPPHYGVGHTIAGFIFCNEQLRRRGKEMRRSAFETRRRERKYRREELRAEREAEKNAERHE